MFDRHQIVRPSDLQDVVQRLTALTVMEISTLEATSLPRLATAAGARGRPFADGTCKSRSDRAQVTEPGRRLCDVQITNVNQ